MVIMLLAYGFTAIVEIGLHTGTDLWRVRKPLAAILAVATLTISSAAIALSWNVLSVLFALAGLYRAFNDVRLVKGRMHERYLQRATRRTAFSLLGLQTAVGLLWLCWPKLGISTASAWVGLAVMQLLAAVMVLASTIRRLRRTMWRPPRLHMADAELPSLTVAIPARNETEALAACLQSLTASNYPKLEIIVLDDCSQNKHTPEIIRSFAHDGVRFVQGEQPKPTWLPKNQAYARLAAEASGAYVLFCGVDVQFAPDTLRQIMLTMLGRRKKMIDVMPQRQHTAYTQFAIVQAARYAWELMPPRRMFGRPAVLGSCWMIEAAALKAAGGFEAVSRSIVPEAYFAKRMAALGAYSFLRSSPALGLLSAKQASEQRATAIRTRYPQVHRRPEHVLLVSWLEFGLLALPLVLAMAGGLGAPLPWLVTALSLAAGTLLTCAFACLARAAHVIAAWSAPLAFPLAVLTDICLLHYSMWRYEFSVVEWRGRNICIPAMHVIPHLPEMQ